MFSSESTCNPLRNKLSLYLKNTCTTTNQKLSATHTLAQTNSIKSQQYFEPASSVRCRRIYLQTDVRSYLYVTWHSVLMKINEVWIFDLLRFREFCSAQIICWLQWNYDLLLHNLKGMYTFQVLVNAIF